MSAKNALRENPLVFIEIEKAEPNGYQEFKRTMGTGPPINLLQICNQIYTSEELSAEVLKKLKGYIRDEEVTSAVITVPAMLGKAN